MELAIHLTTFPADPTAIAATLTSTAHAVEEAGCAALTLMDHWFQMEQLGGPEQPMLEGYTSLGYLAAVTERVQLGLLVTGTTYRHPGLLAKVVSTLDVLSGGRALLGIGAAWYEREHLGLGVRFPPLAERFERLEETLRICRQMWSDDDGPFTGRHYHLAETLCRPRGLRPQGPPVLVGGMGEQKTLRLVATYADACNLFDAGAEVIAHKVEVLDGHCAAVGRDPSEVAVTVIAGGDPLDDRDAFLATMRTYAGLGVRRVWVAPPDAEGAAAWVRRVGKEIVPRLAELEVSRGAAAL